MQRPRRPSPDCRDRSYAAVSDSGEYRGNDRADAADGDYASVYQLWGTSILINMACMGIAMSVRLYGQDVEDDLPLPLPKLKDETTLFLKS